MKKCVICGGNVFSGDYCWYHRGYTYKDREWARKKPQKSVKKVSDKQKRVNSTKAKIKARLMALNKSRCFFCGGRAVDLVHIIRQGDTASLRDEEANCVIACRRCHDIFDNKNYTTLKNIDWALGIMEALDEKYYNRFVNRAKS